MRVKQTQGDLREKRHSETYRELSCALKGNQCSVMESKLKKKIVALERNCDFGRELSLWKKITGLNSLCSETELSLASSY